MDSQYPDLTSLNNRDDDTNNDEDTDLLKSIMEEFPKKHIPLIEEDVPITEELGGDLEEEGNHAVTLGIVPNGTNDYEKDNDDDDHIQNSVGDTEVDGKGRDDITPSVTSIHKAVENGQIEAVDYILRQNKGAANEANEQGYTPLHIAAESGYINIMKVLLKYGARINARGSEDGVTPLQKAVVNGQKKVVEYLCGLNEAAEDIYGKTANVFLPDDWGCTVLHKAAEKGYHDIVQYLLGLPFSYNHLDDVDVKENTPLDYAKKSTDEKTIELLTKDKNEDAFGSMRKFSSLRGYTTKWKEKVATNPIEKVCVDGDLESLKMKLNNLEENVREDFRKTKGDKGDTAKKVIEKLRKLRKHYQLYSIHRACEMEDTDTIEEWIDKDEAYVDAKDKNGYTPLMVAVEKGKRQVVKLLVDEPYYANLYITNHDMKNCLHIAVESYTAEHSEAKKILKKILKAGASWMINSVDKRHRTPLHYAAERGNHEALDILLREASHLEDDDQGMSPLHLAVEKESLECVSLIVNRPWYNHTTKEIIDRKDKKKNTALKIAAKKGNSKICKFLLENGADVKHLKCAQNQFFIDIFETLISTHPQRVSEAEDDQRNKGYDFPLVQDEINCLKALIPQVEEVKRKTFALRMWDHVKFYSTLVTCPLLPSLNIKEIVSKNWATKTISKMKKQVYYVLENAEDESKMTYGNHKVIKMLRKDMQNKKGEQKYVIMKDIVKSVPVVAKYLLEKSIETKVGKEEATSDNTEEIDGVLKPVDDSQLGNEDEDEDEDEDKSNGKQRKTYHFDLFDAQHQDGVREPFFAPIAMKAYCRDLLKKPLTKRLMTVKWNRLGLPFATFGFAFYVLFLTLLTTTVVMEKENEQTFAATGTNINITEYYLLYNDLDKWVNEKNHFVYSLLDVKADCLSHYITNRNKNHTHSMKLDVKNLNKICSSNLTAQNKTELKKIGLDTVKLCPLSNQTRNVINTNQTEERRIVKEVPVNLARFCPLNLTRIIQVRVLSWVIFFLAIFLVLKEFLRFRFTVTMAMIIQDPLHILELFTYVFTVVFLGPFLRVSNLISLEVDYLFKWKWEAGALSILVGWITLLLYMKTVPVFGIYVWMFEEVTKTVVKVIFALIFLLVAFASCWYILLSQSLKHYRVYSDAFMKTFRLTFGEFEFDKMFVESGDVTYEALTYAVYLAFLMLMPILFMNLLVGLAVGDIGAVEDSAADRHINNQVMALENFNKTFPKLLLENLYKKRDMRSPVSWFQSFRLKLSNMAFWNRKKKQPEPNTNSSHEMKNGKQPKRKHKDGYDMKADGRGSIASSDNKEIARIV